MKGRRTKRTTKRNSKPNPWFVETYREASNAFCKEAIPPIASPIFDVQNNFEFGVENEVFFKTKFPFHQKIRGDGACYFNACLAGILNKCVNNPQRWNQFRQNLINKDCRKIANQIGEEGETLTRQKVNELLQVRGDANIVRHLSKKLLVPMHAAFILNRERLIVEQSKRLDSLVENSEEHINALLAIQRYEADINLYDADDITNIYYESDVSPIVNELANSLNLDFQTLSKEIVEGINDEIASVINFGNPNAIFLWNPGGGAHFDLLYSHADENLQKDVDEARGVLAKNPKPRTLNEDQSQKDEISNYSKWEFINKSEKITPAESTPDTKIEVISATPVITNQKSVWFNDDGRGNKFRVITGVYGIETDNPQIEIGQTFIGILQKLAAEENLTKDQVLEIIELSKIKGGVSNKYDLATQKYSENDESENVADLKTAQIFSRKFQRECEKCGIYTGREGENVKMVGLRLTFIPDDVVDAYKTDNIPDFSHAINSFKERVSQKISSQQH
jgi:hypothetical protein